MCYCHCVGSRIAQNLLDRFGLNFLNTFIVWHKTYCSIWCISTIDHKAKIISKIYSKSKIKTKLYCLFVLKWAVYPSQGLSSKSRQDQPKLYYQRPGYMLISASTPPPPKIASKFLRRREGYGHLYSFNLFSGGSCHTSGGG